MNKNEKNASYAVGIDLGTTKSVISYCKRRLPETISVEGRNTLPSVVSFREDGGVLVGRAAKGRIILDPQNTVSSSKRFMGDPLKSYRVGHRSLTPVDIASIILKKLVESARQSLGAEVWDAVITVPAFFDDAQREDTKRAGEEAGLNVLRLIPEPSAAAYAYALDKGKDQTILVYDLGGGTFDVSILEVKKNNFVVKAVDGDSHLGGDDFDEALMAWANEVFRDQTGLDVLRGVSRESLVARQRLKEACEAAKIELSESNAAHISVPDCLGHPLELPISRLDFDRATAHLLSRTVEKIKAVLRAANLRTSDIDRVILVGGSTRMRAVQRIVSDEIKEPFIADNVEEVVAHGAAIVASKLFLPEEDNSPVEIHEVTAHTLGVDMLSDNRVVFRPIIPKQSPYPCRRGYLGRATEHQEVVNIGVYRGESMDPNENKLLGELSLPVTNPEANDVPIGVIFELDTNGIIHFTAVRFPSGSESNALIAYARGNNYEINLEIADELLRKGLATSKTVDVKA